MSGPIIRPVRPVKGPNGQAGPARPYGQLNQDAETLHFGIQSGTHVWDTGDMKSIALVDTLVTDAAWRVSVIGENIRLLIRYGTYASLAIELADLPAEFDVPGKCTVVATPISSEGGARASATLTKVTRAELKPRRLFTVAGALPDAASKFTALVAATLTVRGVAVAVPALGVVPLVHPSVLVTGSGICELTV